MLYQLILIYDDFFIRSYVNKYTNKRLALPLSCIEAESKKRSKIEKILRAEENKYIVRTAVAATAAELYHLHLEELPHYVVQL